MPKLKSKRAAMKRYRFTAKRRVKIKKPGMRHNLHTKTEKRKRALGRSSYLPGVQAEKVRRLLPYSSR